MNDHESILATARLLNIEEAQITPEIYEELRRYAGMSISEIVAARDVEAA